MQENDKNRTHDQTVALGFSKRADPSASTWPKTSVAGHILAATTAGLWLCVVVLFPLQAFGHKTFTAGKVNRYATLRLSASRVRLTYLLYFGALPAMRIRSSWDKDHDGRLSQNEIWQGTSKLSADLASKIVISLDAQRLTSSALKASADTKGDHRVRPVELLVAFDGTWEMPPHGRHELIFDDQAALEPVGEIHVEVLTTDAIRLLESHTGSWSAGITKAFSFTGPASSIEDRRIFITWSKRTRPAPSQPKRRHGTSATGVVPSLVAMGIFALIGLFVTWYWLTRKGDKHEP